MSSQQSFQQLQTLVAQQLDAEPTATLTGIAEQLGLSEGAVTFALPEDMVSVTAGKHTEQVLTLLPSWGNVTTIVHSFGSIFEFKNPFPKGKSASGYYNIMGKEGLHGHLRIDLITHIAFVSKPFRSMESHYIGFYDESGNCVFKVYVGRDKKRQLLTEQVSAFNALKQTLCAKSEGV